jgi:predicted double-glycine peptidase
MRRAATALLVLLFAAGTARAGDLVPATAGGTIYNVHVKSLVDLRFENVVHQAYDLSCGAAALATLLKYFYGEHLSEADVIAGAASIGDKEKIEKEGFSMLELKRYSEKLGYVSAGFRIEDVDELTNLKVPVLALVNSRGYAHFVVLKGVVGGTVLIADPAFGNRKVALDGFAREWGHVVLAVLNEKLAGNPAFRTHTTVAAREKEVPALLDFGLHTLSPSHGDF